MANRRARAERDAGSERSLEERPNEPRRLDCRVVRVDDAAVIERRSDLVLQLRRRDDRERLLESPRLRLRIAYQPVEGASRMRAEKAPHIAPVAVDPFFADELPE